MNHKSLDFKFDVKAVGEDGTFEGYGSVFNAIDSHSDIVVKGAFVDSLENHRKSGSLPALLWQHDSDRVAGVFTEMYEDDHGLFVKGKLALKTTLGSDAHELLKMKAITGMSIGYVTREEKFDKSTGINTLSKLDLWEVSIVTFPSNSSARVSAVKSIEDLKSAESCLRDLGMSRKDAQTFLSRVKGLLLSDSDNGEMKQLLDAIKLRSAAIPFSKL